MKNLKTKDNVTKSGEKKNTFFSLQKEKLGSRFPLFKKNHTYISEGIILRGDLIAEERVTIDGKMFGNICSTKHLSLGATSHFEGNIESASALISGYVKGRIQAKTLVVKVPATIIGDLISTSVQIESGVILQGKILSNPRENLQLYETLPTAPSTDTGEGTF